MKINNSLNFINKRPLLRRAVVTFICISIWILIIFPTFSIYRSEGQKNESKKLFGYQAYSENRIDVFINLFDVKLEKRTATGFVKFLPKGSFIQHNNTLSKNINANWDFFEKRFLKNELMDPFELKFLIEDGNIREFPFDSYKTIFHPILQDENGPIPTRIIFKSITTNLKIIIDEIETNGEKLFYIFIHRTLTSLLFSAFLIACMWGLSISLLCLTWDALVKTRKVEPPHLALGVTMLFALPKLRDSQPGIPHIGCLGDILGFFWNMFIIAFCSIAIIYTYSLKWKPKK